MKPIIIITGPATNRRDVWDLEPIIGKPHPGEGNGGAPPIREAWGGLSSHEGWGGIGTKGDELGI